jgi:hypothetical protein
MTEEQAERARKIKRHIFLRAVVPLLQKMPGPRQEHYEPIELTKEEEREADEAMRDFIENDGRPR